MARTEAEQERQDEHAAGMTVAAALALTSAHLLDAREAVKRARKSLATLAADGGDDYDYDLRVTWASMQHDFDVAITTTDRLGNLATQALSHMIADALSLPTPEVGFGEKESA